MEKLQKKTREQEQQHSKSLGSEGWLPSTMIEHTWIPGKQTIRQHERVRSLVDDGGPGQESSFFSPRCLVFSRVKSIEYVYIFFIFGTMVPNAVVPNDGKEEPAFYGLKKNSV